MDVMDDLLIRAIVCVKVAIEGAGFYDFRFTRMSAIYLVFRMSLFRQN
jgi:hypothetical protein